MSEYISGLGGVMILCAFLMYLIPNGGTKQFAHLAMGFVILLCALSPPRGKLSLDFPDITKVDTSVYEAQYKAEVMKEHKKNLQNIIEEKTQHGSKAYVQTDSSGNITRVTLRCKGDESRAVAYIINTLGVKRERIFTEYENN